MTSDKTPKTLEELQAEANKVQDHIQGAIKRSLRLRAGLCNQAAEDTEYAAAVQYSNAMVCDLLNAHSNGISLLMEAPGPIKPRFGGK